MGLKHILFSLLILSVVSCTTLRTAYIEVQIPAEVTFPVELKNAALVNNAPKQPKTYGHTRVLKRLYRSSNQNKIMKREKVELDSLGFAVLYNTYNNIDKANFFDSTIVVNNNFGEDKAFYETGPLNWSAVRKIAKQNNADVIISLDAFMYKSTVALKEYYKGWQEDPTMEVSYEALWRVYDPLNKVIIDKLLVKDTVFWTGQPTGYSTYALPTREDAISEAAWIAGEKSAKKLIPYNKEVERFFYSGGSRYLNQGSAHFTKGRYSEAIERWIFLYNISNNALKKSKVAHNIALAFETMGDIDSAYEWINKAIAVFPTINEFNKFEYEYISDYAKVLKQRKVDVLKVSTQFYGQDQ